MKYEVEGSRPRGRPKRNRTRGCGKRPPSTQIKHRGCYGSLYTEEVDKEWLMIRVDVNGWMFLIIIIMQHLTRHVSVIRMTNRTLLVLAHLGSPRQRAIKCLLLLLSGILTCISSQDRWKLSYNANTIPLCVFIRRLYLILRVLTDLFHHILEFLLSTLSALLLSCSQPDFLYCFPFSLYLWSIQNLILAVS